MVKRRSARISQLEERARVQPIGLARTSTSPPSRKRGPKHESLVSEFTRSLANLHHQGGVYTHNNINDSAAQPHESEHLPSLQQIPPKPTLELFLDVLQRRDMEETFAQPVNDEEVVGYYDIIKEPMDFGTMRAKLHEGLYTSLEQFKRDVFLISSNAMAFNASNTRYYRQADAIRKLAERFFDILKRDPGSFQVEATRMRRRPDRRVQHQASNSHSRVRRSGSLNGFPFKRKAQMLRCPSRSNSFIDHCSNGASTSGLLDDMDLYSCPVDKRRTYMPQRIGRENDSIVSEVLKAPKSLQQVNSAGTQYTNSLMRFVEDLGPTAQTVAQMKYPTHASKTPSVTPFFGLAPEPSAFQHPAFMSGGIADILCNTSAARKGKAVYTDNAPSHRDFGASRPIPNLNLAGNEGATWSGNANALNLSMDHGASGGYGLLTGHGGSGSAPTAPTPPPQAYFTWLLNHPEPARSTSAQRPLIVEGPNAVEQYYAGKAAELARLKQTNGEGPRILDLRVSGRPLPRGQSQGQGGRSPAPHLLGQNYGARTVRPMGSNLAAHSVLNANNTFEPVGWRMRNGDGSSSGRDHNNMGRAVQWRLPERLGLSTSDLNHMENSWGVGDRQVTQSRAPVLSTVNFFGGSGSQGHGQAQESSMKGDGLPDLDLQL